MLLENWLYKRRLSGFKTSQENIVGRNWSIKGNFNHKCSFHEINANFSFRHEKWSYYQIRLQEH